MNPETKTEPTNRVADEANMIVAERQQKAMAETMDRVFGASSSAFIHNFTGDAKTQWRMTAMATGPLCKSFDDLPSGGAINLTNYYVHRITIESERGELVDCCRSVLFDKSGAAYAFVSDILARDLARLVATFGPQGVRDGVAIRVVRSEGKGSHKFYSIVPA